MFNHDTRFSGEAGLLHPSAYWGVFHTIDHSISGYFAPSILIVYDFISARRSASLDFVTDLLTLGSLSGGVGRYMAVSGVDAPSMMF